VCGSNSGFLCPDAALCPKLNFQVDIKILEERFTVENVGTECVKDTQWL
jgi:hypothetical protein